MFGRLGLWCHDHRRAVLGIWVALLVAAMAFMGTIGADSRSEFSLPDVESRQGIEILEESFGGAGAGQSGSLVFRADRPVTDPSVQAPMEALITEIDDIEGLTVQSPYGPLGARYISQKGASAGQVAYAEIEVDPELTFEEAQEIALEVRAAIDEVEADTGIEIYLGGQVFAEFEAPESEILGLGFAIFILILAFGSVLAMGLPIGVAVFGVTFGVAIIAALSHVINIPDFATTLGAMIGLGVGIDYALFIVTRYRESLHVGHDERRATGIALDTAGRAVVFAGTTVVISLLGMLIMNISFVTGLAIGAASVVTVTMAASVTLLPALLGFAGDKVEVTRRRGLVAASLVAVALVGIGLKQQAAAGLMLIAVLVLVAGHWSRWLKTEVRLQRQRPNEETVAYRWSRAVQHHPWRSLIAGIAILGVLAIPALDLRLAFADEGNYAEGNDAREAYDLLAEGFGPGFNGALLLVAEAPEGADAEDLAAVTDALNAPTTEGVALVEGPFPNDFEGDATAYIWRVVPTTAPQDEETAQLVSALRDDVLPAATSESDLEVLVTGSVAVQVDFSNYLAERLPIFVAAVLALSFLLLMVVFRSLLVPVKAVFMNLLSIAAAYGVVVAAFQWGWLGGPLGFEGAPVEPFIPMMLFAIVFGLSMDYEVFLLSRVREEWDRTGDSHLSVANGLASTARVISAAALIMVFVFGSFLLEADRTVKLFGMGLATAVLLDATIVRMLLVPATMELLGDRNWWLPSWLDRILPTIDVEGHHELDEPEGQDPGDPDDTLDPDSELQPA